MKFSKSRKVMTSKLSLIWCCFHFICFDRNYNWIWRNIDTKKISRILFPAAKILNSRLILAHWFAYNTVSEPLCLLVSWRSYQIFCPHLKVVCSNVEQCKNLNWFWYFDLATLIVFKQKNNTFNKVFASFFLIIIENVNFITIIEKTIDCLYQVFERTSNLFLGLPELQTTSQAVSFEYKLKEE